MFNTGLGALVPAQSYAQRECWEALLQSARFHQLRPRSHAILKKVLNGSSGIATRYLALENLGQAFGLSPDVLQARFEAAVFDEGSFCSVAGISLRPYRAAAWGECCIGDALTMTPPVTGNGMSMAFEAAEMAIAPPAAYSRGECSWDHARQSIAAACDRAFAPRLAWARWLQWMMFTPLLQGRPGALALRLALLWQVVFAHTR